MGEKMKKILFLGSGFLSSNIIRYITYRSKNEFRFTTVSRFSNNDDYTKYSYKNKNHNIFIGDVYNHKHTSKIIQIQKPDIIIDCTGLDTNSVGVESYYLYEMLRLKMHNAIAYSKYCDHFINFFPYGEEAYKVCDNFYFKKATSIWLPNCFGMRENSNGYIKSLISSKEDKLPANPVHWAYAEDIASFVWFVIEKKLYGHLNMPTIGSISLFEIHEIIEDVFKKEKAEGTLELYDESVWGTCTEYTEDESYGWKSDYKDLKPIITKVVRWYYANKWALH